MFRWLNRNRLIILTYHSVLPPTSGIDGGEARNVVDQEMFAWQMRYLAKHFCCLRLEEAVELLRSRRPLPQYSMVVTFDDGFQNNLRYAFPVLRRFGVPATIFVTTGHIGHGMKLLWTEHVGRMLRAAKVSEETSRREMQRLKSMPSHQRDEAIRVLENRCDSDQPRRLEPDADRYTFLTWSETRELARGGITIGSHTVAHPIMSSLDDDRRRVEVVESRQEIERQLGTPCTLFSYPNGTAGDFDERDKASLREAGYVAAVSQIAGVNDERTDRFALRRVNIGRGHTPQLFVAQVSGFWPWLRSLSGWLTGRVAVSDRVLGGASGEPVGYQ
jgi:peptidoglycan/xylan/chitin deacetylase (PgdA/CDA1 family)